MCGEFAMEVTYLSTALTARPLFGSNWPRFVLGFLRGLGLRAQRIDFTKSLTLAVGESYAPLFRAPDPTVPRYAEM